MTPARESGIGICLPSSRSISRCSPIVSRRVAVTSSIVAPVAIQPGTSGAYAEKLERVLNNDRELGHRALQSSPACRTMFPKVPFATSSPHCRRRRANQRENGAQNDGGYLCGESAPHRMFKFSDDLSNLHGDRNIATEELRDQKTCERYGPRWPKLSPEPMLWWPF